MAPRGTPWDRSVAGASLEKRGLNDMLLDRNQTALARAEALGAKRPEPKISEEIQAKSASERREAYEKLNLWFIDWGETFRQELPCNALKSLGLVAPPRKPTIEPKTPPEPVYPT